MLILLAETLDPVTLPGWAWSIATGIVGTLVVGLVLRSLGSLDKRLDKSEKLIEELQTDLTDLRVEVARGDRK